MFTSFILLVFIVNLIPKFDSYKTIFYLTFLIIPSNILMSLWFYIGMEKVKYLSLLMLVSKSLYIILVFIFVKKPEDYIKTLDKESQDDTEMIFYCKLKKGKYISDEDLHKRSKPCNKKNGCSAAIVLIIILFFLGIISYFM